MAKAGLPHEVGKDFFDALGEGEPPIDDIIRASALIFGVTKGEILGTSRRKDITTARSAAICLCVRKRAKKYNALKDIFKRDHTTIIHASNKTVFGVTQDPECAGKIAAVWELAMQGRKIIAERERARDIRFEIECELENERLREQTEAMQLSDLKDNVKNKVANPKLGRSIDGMWTYHQLQAMNLEFTRYIIAYGDGSRY